MLESKWKKRKDVISRDARVEQSVMKFGVKVYVLLLCKV